MGVTFGATHSAYGLMQTDTAGTSVAIAEARDDDGKMHTRNAYSKVLSQNHEFITTTTAPEAGSTITAGGKTHLIENTTVRRENVGFQRATLSATAHDSEALMTTFDEVL